MSMRSLAVARTLEELRVLAPKKTAVTIGVFDGVHVGHRQVLEELVARREQGSVDGVWVVTFDPHPLTVTHSREAPPILSTIDERIELFSTFGLDGVFVLHFDEATAHIEYRDFIQRYFLDAMDMRELVMGYDCHFGYQRQGSPEAVSEEGARRGFGVSIMPPVYSDGEVVSSTTIRAALQSANLERANHLLGHAYLVHGTVAHGQGRGRDLGFPTANVSVQDPQKQWPASGVYAVRVVWRGRIYEGMMNIGRSPTMKRVDHDEMEVHIFDFGHSIYGEEVSVYCEGYLRPEKRFPTVTALIEQLNDDRRVARQRLAGG
jgi:riboflavin kinase/FMN adenylyltransferase